MQLHLSILPTAQQRLWIELSETPDHFVLCGGTAIALQLGHRESVDFDFFSHESFDPFTLAKQISYLENAVVLETDKNTLTCSVVRENAPVKISFFGNLSHKKILSPHHIKSPSLNIASLLDLAGMKAAVIQKRAAARDYIDIEALITQANINLAQILAAGLCLYDSRFNPQVTIKALTYYGEEELQSIPVTIRNHLLHAVETLNSSDIDKEFKMLQEKYSQ